MNAETEKKPLDLRGLSDHERDQELGVLVHYHCNPMLKTHRRELMRVDYEPAVVYYDDKGREVLTLSGRHLSQLAKSSAVLGLLEEFKNGWRCERPSDGVSPRHYRVVVKDDNANEHVAEGPTFPFTACVAALRAAGVEVIC